MTQTRDMIQLPLIADLRAAPVSDGARAFVPGGNAPSDGLGGIYRWDPSVTAAEDAAFLNIVASNVTSTGRWVREFQRAQQLPHGVLVNIGGVKTFYADGVTIAGGTASLILTMDGKDSGEPIFKKIWHNVARARTTAQTASDAVQSFLMAEANDLKSTKHGFTKANVTTIVLGGLISPLAMVGANVAVSFKIEGI
jgi:hypothetical protein